MKKKLAFVILFLAVGIAVITIYRSTPGKQLDYIQLNTTNQTMIPFTLKDLDGREHVIDPTNNKPKFINFWTSWCTYCKDEAKHINSLYSKYKDEVEFVSVNVTTSDELGAAKAFIEKYNVTIPALLDEDGKVSSQYRVMGIPTNFFVRRDGTILAITEDITTSSAEPLFKELISK